MPPRPLAALVALAAAALPPAAARAGAPEGAPREVRVPWTVAAEQDGAEAAVGHAAGLGFLEGFEAAAGLSWKISGPLPAAGVLGVAAGRLGPLALGLGVARVGEDEGLRRATRRVDVALAARLGEVTAVGLRWHGLSGSPGGALDDYKAWAASATVRPARGLSVALGLDRFDRPRLAGRTQDMLARVGLGIRPRSERITFGLEGAVEPVDDPAWLAGGSLRFMPVPGVVVGGYGRYVGGGDDPDRLEFGGLLAFEQGRGGVETSLDRSGPVADDEGRSSTSMAALLRASSRPRPSLVAPDHRLVRLVVGGPIPERPSRGLLGGEKPAFAAWLAALDAMAGDPELDGVLLDLRGAPGWGQAWELRRALERMKRAGKKVYARLTTADMRTYYLASVADRIYLHPAGGLQLTGLAITRRYYGGLLDLVGVEAQFVAYEEYKSAPEAWTRRGPSEPSREQTRAILDAFDRTWLDAVGQGRGLARDAVLAALRDGPQSMKDAHALRLVDRLVADDAVEDAVREDVGLPVTIVDGYRPSPRAWPRWGATPRVAIVPVVGTIVDGRGQPLPLPFLGETVGDEEVVAALDAAVADGRVAAIVVRVASPGGAVVASDRMYEAVRRAGEKKPLVVSFGDVAASGGYYLAAGAKALLASPLTLTGSIGIYTGKVDLSTLYARLGIGTDTQRTLPRADAFGLHRPWTEEEVAVARERLKDYYDRFVGVVAAGRGLTPEEARERARGRVWTGGRALALGLVTAEGGLWDAIQRARAEAGIPGDAPVRLVYLGQKGGLGALSGLLGRAAALVSEPAPSLPLAGWLPTLEAVARGGLQARLPFDLDIR